MIDLLKCGIQDENIRVFDLHVGMEPDELKQYDVVCDKINRYNYLGCITQIVPYLKEIIQRQERGRENE